MNDKTQNGRSGRWIAGASVIAATIASACCWLPLVVLGLGMSAAGIGAGFERHRPLFLILAALLLGVGFYLAYFRRGSCAADKTCSAPDTRLARSNRGTLWVAAILAGAMALFPNYAGVLSGSGVTGSSGSQGPASDGDLTLRIEGMTCAGCAIPVQSELAAVSGVRSSTVSYDDGTASVLVDPASPPSPASLIEAVRRAGFRASVAGK